MPASPARLDVTKTYKLFVNGAFPRSESGRSMPVHDARGRVVAHVAHASRKDLRDAVEAARGACEKWRGASGYNRGQILYRMGEMMEGKRTELAEAIAAVATPAGSKGKVSRGVGLSPDREVALSIDRLVHYAGWCDKHAQVLGSHNPVAGPYYNFTVPEAVGVVGVVCPSKAPLLGLVSLLAPVLTSGNACVVLASQASPLVAAVLGEVLATSDLPAGVVNILTGPHGELLGPLASHRDVDALCAMDAELDAARVLREGTAENLKRVWFAPIGAGQLQQEEAQGLAWIQPFVEFKTIWHPALA